jgi:predicted nuclease with TOPRIM domain
MKEIKVNMDIIEHSAIPELRELARQEVLTRFAALKEKVKDLTTKLEVEHSEYQTIIAELEKENTDYKHAFDLLWEYCVKLEQQNAELKSQVEDLKDRDNEPEYHSQGMGCGLEDRNITDRYQSMYYGWEKAIERMYELIDNTVGNPTG